MKRFFKVSSKINIYYNQANFIFLYSDSNNKKIKLTNLLTIDLKYFYRYSNDPIYPFNIYTL